MSMRGAIFDCDGTLLDSMPMWTEQCVGLLERYGVRDAQRVFAEHESLDMDKKCFWYHENLGIGESGEALLDELWENVRAAYRRDVRPYEGVREFLEELRAKGVPCITLSSTPTSLLREALEDHGLLGYFKDLLFVGDVGRGKEYSDCYAAACRSLGFARDETWVFEDAPFGVRSAARAGMPTVAILNDHDGRDEGFMRKWATVVQKSYVGLRPSDLESLCPHVLNALVVGGSPEPASAALVSTLAGRADFVVAADRGLDALRKANARVDAYCGDKDSASAEALDWAEKCGVRMDVHPTAKDYTDLELAVGLARDVAEQRGAALRLTLTCASGGRADHALGVYGALAKNADAFPVLCEDSFECRVLSSLGCDAWHIEGRVGATLSVMSLAADTRVTESGMAWNLDQEALEVLAPRGVSNVVEKDRALVRCDTGTVAVFLHVD